MLTMKKHGLMVPVAPDASAPYAAMLTAQVNDITKIIDNVNTAAAEFKQDGKLVGVELAKKIDQARTHALALVEKAVADGRKNLELEHRRESAKGSKSDGLTSIRSAQSVLQHNVSRARKLLDA